MKAIRYHGPDQPFKLEQVATPEPGPGCVRVKITASAMCHTELHFLDGVLNLGIQPLTMGHEIVGRIDAAGPNTDTSRIGERVIVYYYSGCGKCPFCLNGEEQICPSLRQEYGFISDGGYAEYIIIPERNAVPLPDNIDDINAAPIGCGVTTAVHSARLTDLKAGEWAVIYGAGAVGFGLIQLAKYYGARVIAIGRTPAKLKKAAELGAQYCINANSTEVVSEVRKITDAQGADVIFECVGSKETMPLASQMLGRRGRLIFIGYTGPDFTVNPVQLIVFEQKIMGSVGASLGDLHTAVDLVSRGIINTVIDHTLPLEDFETAIRGMKSGKLVGKAVLTP
jgi:propanol-preferring alcohol dehydrogenase